MSILTTVAERGERLSGVISMSSNEYRISKVMLPHILKRTCGTSSYLAAIWTQARFVSAEQEVEACQVSAELCGVVGAIAYEAVQ
jgi:hypothetical protein